MSMGASLAAAILTMKGERIMLWVLGFLSGGALVGAITSIIVCVINNNKQNALILYRLEQLERKQDKHNNLIERTYRLEETAAIHDEKIRVNI